MTTALTLTAATCKPNAGSAALGGIILLVLIGAIALFAILYGQAHNKLTRANAELAFLRPAFQQLQGAASTVAWSPPTRAMNAGWHPDPTERHEYRLFNGYTWDDDVADAGVVAKDPLTDQG
jgi:hypothetical protein